MSLLLTIAISLVNISFAFAKDYASINEHKISSGYITRLGSAVPQYGGVEFTAGIQFQGGNISSGVIDSMTINLSSAIPAGSYFYVTGNYYNAVGSADAIDGFYGLSTISANFIILDSQVTNLSGTNQREVQFSYLIYANNTISTITFGNNAMFAWDPGRTSFHLSHIVSAQPEGSTVSSQLSSILTYLQYQDDQNNEHTTLLRRIIQFLEYQDDQNNEHTQQLDEIIEKLGNIEVNGSSAAVVDKLDEMDEKDDQDRDNLEEQQSDTQAGADDSQTDAQNTGSTLLTAFTGFVGALTSASPSNCVIDMNMGNMDLGNVDFCKMSPPPVFQTIASIMLIAFCVPLSIATATKVIELFRSFQS